MFLQLTDSLTMSAPRQRTMKSVWKEWNNQKPNWKIKILFSLYSSGCYHGNYSWVLQVHGKKMKKHNVKTWKAKKCPQWSPIETSSLPCVHKRTALLHMRTIMLQYGMVMSTLSLILSLLLTIHKYLWLTGYPSYWPPLGLEVIQLRWSVMYHNLTCSKKWKR